MGRLTDEARRHEVLVQAALTLASELSLPAVLQKIVDLACEVAEARYGALGVVGASGRISEFVTHGITPEQRRAIGPLPEGHGLLGVLIMEGTPLRLRRIQDHPRSSGFPPNHPPMTSFLGVPVAIRGNVFGNLYLTEKQGAGEFTEGDEDAVVKLAAHAAVAIENARLYTEAQLGQRRLAAVNEIAQAILEGGEIEDVLGLIARSARDLAGAQVATVAAPVDGEQELTVRAGEAEAADAPQGPALSVPLALGEREFGTLTVANHAGGRAFLDDDLAVVQAFAAQAAVALEHARIQGELKRLMLIEDRERIAKELHDDVIQSLFAEGMALQASLAMLDDRDAMESRITQAVEHIDRVIRDLRNYIFALRPGTAADHALERSLRDVAQSFSSAAGVGVEVVVDRDTAAVLAGRAGDVLQAAREAISNAVRHSGGDRVRVGLAAAGDEAVLEVADNGKGFDPDLAEGRGQGLANLRERANALGGELDIETALGRGTWVRIRIPL